MRSDMERISFWWRGRESRSRKKRSHGGRSQIRRDAEAQVARGRGGVRGVIERGAKGTNRSDVFPWDVAQADVTDGCEPRKHEEESGRDECRGLIARLRDDRRTLHTWTAQAVSFLLHRGSPAEPHEGQSTRSCDQQKEKKPGPGQLRLGRETRSRCRAGRTDLSIATTLE